MRTQLPIALAAILFATTLSGCAKKPEFDLPADGVSRFPTGEVLEEGDVILARSYGLIGAMFATQSQDGGEYSHGAMLYRDANGHLLVLNYRPTGMESPSCTPEEFFSRYNRLALLRYGRDIDQARAPDYLCAPELRGKAAISATARYWIAKNAAQRIPPDYRLDHDEHSRMFCLELASTVLRDCGLPDPFFKAKKADEDPLLITANRLFKANVMEIRSPSSALDNPDYVKINSWIRPEFDLRMETLNEELMRTVVDDLKNGMLPGRPNMLGKMKLRQVFALYHIVTKTMFWKPKQDLPDFIDNEVIDNAYMLYCYLALSKKTARQRMEAETTPVYIGTPGTVRDPMLERVRQIVRESCANFRHKYMVRGEQIVLDNEAIREIIIQCEK